MLEKEVKIPMIIGTARYGLALVIGALGEIMQKQLLPLLFTHSLDKTVPISILAPLFVRFLMIGVFMTVLLSYKGNARRVAGIIMLVVYSVIGIIVPFLSTIASVFMARSSEIECIAAYNELNSMIYMITSPITLVSSVLVLVALGRYGVIVNKTNN